MITTGIASAFDSDYVLLLQERGSTGSKGMGLRAGVIDSGYRGEWHVALTNHNEHNIIIAKYPEKIDWEGGYRFYEGLGMIGTVESIIYPASKAIAQALLLPIPKVTIEETSYEDLCKYESERKNGLLGSSLK